MLVFYCHLNRINFTLGTALGGPLPRVCKGFGQGPRLGLDQSYSYACWASLDIPGQHSEV